MENHWFGVNRFWGWYPIKLEGWLVAIAMLVSIMSTMFVFAGIEPSLSQLVFKSFPYISLIVAFTILITSIKGVKPDFGKKTSKNYSPDNPKAYLFLSIASIPVVFFYVLSEAILSATILTLVFLILFLVYRNLIKIYSEG